MKSKLNKKSAGFTLVEIMIVVAIIALLAAIAVPNFMRARKRSQATVCLEELRLIDQAISQYMTDFNRAPDSEIAWTDLQPYMKPGTRLHDAPEQDILGNYHWGSHVAGEDPKVGVSVATFNALSDVAPLEFWSPFGVDPES